MNAARAASAISAPTDPPMRCRDPEREPERVLDAVEDPRGIGRPVAASTTCAPYTEEKTLPMTATPTAPPIWRVVSFTAEPTPALASGSEPMIESVAGAIVSAMPAGHDDHAPGDRAVRRRLVETQGEQQAGGHQREAARDDDLGAEALHEPRATAARAPSSGSRTPAAEHRSRAASTRARTGGTA